MSPKGRPKRPNNPGYQAPARLLAGSLIDAQGQARPELTGEAAMALARELLLRGVRLAHLAALGQEAQAWVGLSPAQAHQACLAWARRPEHAATPLLGDWLRVGASLLNGPDAVAAWAAHVRRVAARAGLSAALMAAQLGQNRARRQKRVRQDAKRAAQGKAPQGLGRPPGPSGQPPKGQGLPSRH